MQTSSRVPLRPGLSCADAPPAHPPFRFAIRVYWEDTDAGGVVFYANYLKFFERARTEWLRSLGHAQEALRLDTGAVFIVSETALRYLRPARLDDLIEVSVEVCHAGRAQLTIAQQAWRRRASTSSARTDEIPVPVRTELVEEPKQPGALTSSARTEVIPLPVRPEPVEGPEHRRASTSSARTDAIPVPVGPEHPELAEGPEPVEGPEHRRASTSSARTEGIPFDADLLAEGTIRIACVDVGTFRPCRIPSAILASVASMASCSDRPNSTPR